MLYAVDTQHDGRVTLTVSSPGAYNTDVNYFRNINGVPAQNNDNEIIVTGLGYIQNFTVDVIGISSFCPAVERTTSFPGSFNITGIRKLSMYLKL